MKKKTFGIFLLIGLTIFFLTRLINLKILPIFTDEAIYLRWAQIAKNDASWRFISLTDGKQPLFVWLVMLLMKVIADPLIAGRLVSIFAGLVTLVGIWFLAWELFGNLTIVFFSSLFYLFSPFFLFYDRLAIMDSLLASFFIWSLYFSTSLAKKPKLETAFFLGFAIAGAILTKTSGFFAIYLLPLSLFLFDFEGKGLGRRLLSWFFFALIAVLISQMFYAVLRLSPWFGMIAKKNLVFIFSFSEWIKHPFIAFWGNLRGLSGWLISYLTPPVVFLIILGLILGILKKKKEIIYLFICFLSPFLSLAFFGRVIYPRFVLFMAVPLLLISGYFINVLFKRLKGWLVIFIILILLILVYPLYFCSQIIFNPINTPLPAVDRSQYLDDWPAGFGLNETVAFIKEQAKNGKVFVGAQGTIGLFPAGLELYLIENKNVIIKGYWPLNEIPEEVLKSTQEMPTYIVLKEKNEVPKDWPVEEILKIRRGRGNTYLRLLRILP